MFKEIQSKDNSLIKDIKKYKEKKYRNLNGKFLIEGWKLIEEALKAECLIEYILFDDKQEDKVLYLKDKFQSNIECIKVSKEIIKILCSTETPQGIVALVQKKSYELHFEDGFYILADKVQDPGNIGTIIRSAHGSGAKGIILTKGTVDIYNEKVIRSTMGSMFHIPIFENAEEVICNLKERGYKFVVSSLQTDTNFYEEDLKRNIVICIGNEGNGVSDEIYELADVKVKIPMPGGVESLNVAVAASIMMFEAVRQNLS